jgi:four helix bundle protein
MKFSHEKLIVYQRSLDFIEYTNKIFADSSLNINAYQQLDKASSSVAPNIAEGTGKFTIKDKNHYYDIARGSALECSGCLDILFRRKRISAVLVEEGKSKLVEIVSMLIGLIKSSSDRVYEENIEYVNHDNDLKT